MYGSLFQRLEPISWAACSTRRQDQAGKLGSLEKPKKLASKVFSSPQIGFEPMTNRLTVERSTTELLRNITRNFVTFIIPKKFSSFQLQLQQQKGYQEDRTIDPQEK